MLPRRSYSHLQSLLLIFFDPTYLQQRHTIRVPGNTIFRIYFIYICLYIPVSQNFDAKDALF